MLTCKMFINEGYAAVHTTRNELCISNSRFFVHYVAHTFPLVDGVQRKAGIEKQWRAGKGS